MSDLLSAEARSRQATDAVALPTLFVSHGAPTFALDPGTSGPALTTWAAALRAQQGTAGALRGVVVLSPHWMTRSLAVMRNPQPQTWHDFGGFPKALYHLQYPAAGSVPLADEVLALLADAGLPASPDANRPLDHGTWVPLMHLFPQADIPVVQVSLPAQWGPREVLALGQALAPLRARGVLLLGSGSMTHNLAEFFGGQREAAPYVVAFSRWVEQALSRGDLPGLLDYRALAPHAARAHPTEDHFLPLFFALGAAGGDAARPDYVTREVMFGMLAMDAMALQ